MRHQLTKRGGLRAKIVAWVLIPTAIILSAVGALAFYASQRVTEDLVFDRNRDRTRLLADQLSADLEAYRQPLRVLDVTIGSSWSSTYLQSLLEGRWGPDDLDTLNAAVLVLDQDGTVMAAVPDPAAWVGRDLPDLIAGPDTVLEEDLALTDILMDRMGGTDVIAIRYPLAGVQGGFQGTVVGLFQRERGAILTGTLYRSIWNLYIGRWETAFLVDGGGRVIFRPDTFLIGEDFSQLEAVQRALLASVGQQTGVAVENARLYDQAEKSAAAAERGRLARELHDAVSQTLFSASMIADVLPRLWERDPYGGGIFGPAEGSGQGGAGMRTKVLLALAVILVVAGCRLTAN